MIQIYIIIYNIIIKLKYFFFNFNILDFTIIITSINFNKITYISLIKTS